MLKAWVNHEMHSYLYDKNVCEMHACYPQFKSCDYKPDTHKSRITVCGAAWSLVISDLTCPHSPLTFD